MAGKHAAELLARTICRTRIEPGQEILRIPEAADDLVRGVHVGSVVHRLAHIGEANVGESRFLKNRFYDVRLRKRKQPSAPGELLFAILDPQRRRYPSRPF